MTEPEPTLSSAVPNELSEILKREFNTGVPQIATLAAVVAGTFGVSKFFNAGVWTVIAIITFIIIFLFQQQIPNSVPRTAIYVLALLVCTATLLLGAYACWGSKMGLDDWFQAHGNLATGIVSGGVTASIALLMVSYRKQQRLGGMRYPDIIELAVANQLKSSRFYKSKVKFSIALLSSDERSIDFETIHSYEVVNRSEDPNTWIAEYELNDSNGSVIALTIDGTAENINKFSGSRLVRVAVPIESHQRRVVMITVHDRFRIIDSDIYTSYHPATDLRVEFTNTKCPGLTVEFDTLHVSKYSPGEKGNTRFVDIPDGILPFEGVRLRWRPTQ
jgi:hypothetical protein